MLRALASLVFAIEIFQSLFLDSIILAVHLWALVPDLRVLNRLPFRFSNGVALEVGDACGHRRETDWHRWILQETSSYIDRSLRAGLLHQADNRCRRSGSKPSGQTFAPPIDARLLHRGCGHVFESLVLLAYRHRQIPDFF